MTKRYKNRFDRAMRDMNWGSFDGEEVIYEEDVPKRFRRNKIDGVFGGVCAGIGDYTGLDPVIVRIITVISFFMTGITFFIYMALWVFVPSDKRAPYRREHREAEQAKSHYLSRKARRSRGYARTDSEDFTPPRTTSFRDVKSKFRSLETRLQDLERSITSSEWQLRRDFRDIEDRT